MIERHWKVSRKGCSISLMHDIKTGYMVIIDRQDGSRSTKNVASPDQARTLAGDIVDGQFPEPTNHSTA